MNMPTAPYNIASLVPHQGLMCLIDQIIDHSPETIRCRAQVNHNNHPLAQNGEIPSMVAIEYAAQACAIHGALIDNAGQSKPGFLVKITNTELETQALSIDDGPLTIFAQRLGSTDQGCLYKFKVNTSLRCLAQGSLMIAFTDTYIVQA